MVQSCTLIRAREAYGILVAAYGYPLPVMLRLPVAGNGFYHQRINDGRPAMRRVAPCYLFQQCQCLVARHIIETPMSGTETSTAGIACSCSALRLIHSLLLFLLRHIAIEHDESGNAAGFGLSYRLCMASFQRTVRPSQNRKAPAACKASRPSSWYYRSFRAFFRVSQSRPAFAARSPVGIRRARCIAFTSMQSVADRLIVPARHYLATLRSSASPRYQVRALFAGAPIIGEGVRLR